MSQVPLPYPFAADFEAAVVLHLCQNAPFFTRFGPHLDPTRFNATPARVLATAAVTFGRAHGWRGPASLVIVSQLLAAQHREGKLTLDDLSAAGDYIEDALATLPDYDTVAAMLADELRNLVTKEALSDAVAATAAGKEDAQQRAVDTLVAARTIGSTEAAPVWTTLELDDARCIKPPERLSTGIVLVDALLKGGPERGTMTVWSAKSGMGKSMALNTVAAVAVARGHTTLVVSTEMTKRRWAPRFYGALYDVPYRELELPNSPASVALARRTKRAQDERLWHHPAFLFIGAGRTASDFVSAVRAWEKTTGQFASVVVLDYMDDLVGDGVPKRNKRGDTASHKSDDEMAKFLQLWAENEDRWLHTAAQPQRLGGKEFANKDVTLDNIAGGMGKVRRADLLITMRRVELEDTQEGTYLRFFIAKDRHNGAAELSTDPVLVDWSKARSTTVPPFDWSATNGPMG